MDFHRALLPALVVLGFGSAARADALYAPQPCTSKEMELLVRNPTEDTGKFWIQSRRGREVAEQAFEIAPGASLRLPGTELVLPGGAFSVRQAGLEMIFFLQCRGLMRMTPLASPRVEYDVVHSPGPLSLRLLNLHHASQNVEVSFVNREGRTLHNANVPLDKNYVSTETRLIPPPGTERVLIEGTARLNSQLMTAEERPLKALIPAPAKVAADPGTAYFLAADEDLSQSYIVPLRDPALIEQARRIVATQSPRIIVAEVEPVERASDNRDFLSKDSAPWSWRVSNVLGFSQLASQECSGSPGMIEDFKESWMPGPRGICFWSFHLKLELSPAEVSAGISNAR